MEKQSFKIKRNDQVMVVAGKEKGKTGRVVRVLTDKATVIIEKLNIVKRHTKPTQTNRQGGIVEKENPIAISNVMILCSKCNAPVRTGVKIDDGGKRTRVCRKCDGEI